MSDLNGREMHVDTHAGNQILLEPQVWNEKAMSDVHRSQYQVNRMIHRHRQGAADYVVFARRVGIDNAQRIPRRSIDQLRVRFAKLSVGAGIPEVPGKLLGSYFNVDRSRGRLVKMQLGPYFLAHYRQTPQDYQRDDSPGDLQLVVAVRVCRLARAV